MKLSDERVALVLEQMKSDQKPGNAKAAKVTGAMLLREFLMLRVRAPCGGLGMKRTRFT